MSDDQKFDNNKCYLLEQSDEELKRREEVERAHMEIRERQMFQQRLRQQRLESEADSKWLQQEEQNIELPFSPPPVRLSFAFQKRQKHYYTVGMESS